MLTFPSTIITKTIDFMPRHKVLNFEPAGSFRLQTHDFRQSVWSLTLSFPPLSVAQAREMSGFLAACRGTINSFYYTLPTRFLITAPLSVSITGTEGTSFSVVSGTPEPGRFGVANNRLVQITTATSLVPPFPGHSGTLSISAGPALFRLASNDVSWTVDEMLEIPNLSIPITEALS